jgi:hypothetical protein
VPRGDGDIERIWRQSVTPVVYLPARKGDILVRLPDHRDNELLLSGDGHRRPILHATRPSYYWTLPRSRFSDIVRRLFARLGSVYVIQPHRKSEQCARVCWEASGLECSCSCLGEHHGAQSPEGRWYEVAEACAVRWRDSELRWTLLRPKSERDGLL